MLGLGWLTLRQAQEALRNGQLEEAQRLVSQPQVRGHKGSWELLQQIARAYLERGQQHLDHEDPAGAWNDLLKAEAIGLADCGTAGLRQALTRQGLAEARNLLAAGEATRAGEILAQLRDRGVNQPEFQHLDEAAHDWVLARELANRGEFSQARQVLERVGRLLPEPTAAWRRFQEELEERGQNFGALLVQLHQATDREDWREVLLTAEQVLAAAPQHAEARKARARAWKSIEPATTPIPRSAEEAALSSPPEEPARRFLLWVDGVGGYLVCLASRLTLGQATPDAYVDLPLLADVSRMHAALTRDSEGYLLEALRPVQVNGQTVDQALLQPGDRITLGKGCQLLFTQPVPVSATAQLEVVSGQRLPLAVEKVFLMADTLVLGPSPQSHVVMPDLPQPVVLFRYRNALGVRHAGPLTIDGQACRERGTLKPTSRVTGTHFALAIEPVGARWTPR